jgi:DNA-binding transcriptional regulator YiaG
VRSGGDGCQTLCGGKNPVAPGLVVDYNAGMRTRRWPETPAAFRRIREAIGWTQGRLAEELGVHRITLAQWEGGRRSIPGPVARLLVRVQAEQQALKRRRKGGSRS